MVDGNPPENIIFLKRSSEKAFAPNYFTGIGGKIGDLPGYENETPLEGAYRELKEETNGQLGTDNIKLHEFARCVYENGDTLYYFWGKWNKKELPSISSNDGILMKVPKGNILNNKIIPTTRAVCEEWLKRDCSLNSPFTLFVKETGMDGSVRLIEVIRIKDCF